MNTMQERFNALKEPELYHFFDTNPLLKDNILLLTVAGSNAYGTQTESSDLDVRGILYEQKQHVFGMSHVEQFENKETDTVVFALKKFVYLASKGNPNIIELLGTREEDLFICNHHGRLLKDNRKLFLSKEVMKPFSGFTKQMKKEFGGEDVHAFPKFSEADAYIKKAAKRQMHYIRLKLMLIDILKTGDIITYRENDIELLMNARHGAYMTYGYNPTSGYYHVHATRGFLQLELDLDEAIQKALETTELPDKPNYKAIENLLINILEDKLA